MAEDYVPLFTDAVLAKIKAVMPPDTPPQQLDLLSQLLRVWETEDLVKHLSRDTRHAVKERVEQIMRVRKKARELLEEMALLDDGGTSLLAEKPQMQREGGDRDSVRVRFDFPRDYLAGITRRDEALGWLMDLVESPVDTQQLPSDKGVLTSDKGGLKDRIVLDLAGIFELVTGRRATRRVNTDTGEEHGPFRDFCQCIGRLIDGLDSLDATIKDVIATAQRSSGTPGGKQAVADSLMWRSAFVRNLQFRHSGLWKDLRSSGP